MWHVPTGGFCHYDPQGVLYGRVACRCPRGELFLRCACLWHQGVLCVMSSSGPTMRWRSVAGNGDPVPTPHHPRHPWALWSCACPNCGLVRLQMTQVVSATPHMLCFWERHVAGRGGPHNRIHWDGGWVWGQTVRITLIVPPWAGALCHCVTWSLPNVSECRKSGLVTGCSLRCRRRRRCGARRASSDDTSNTTSLPS
jgi:hypothetical protein